MAVASTVSVQVKFTAREGDHELTDAIYFTEEDYAALEPGQLEAMQQARFENFKAVVTAKPEPAKEPTPKDIQAQVEALTQQKEQIEAQITALAPVLEAKMVSMDQALADGMLVVKG